MKGLIGRKMGMSQIFDENGRAVSVTVIKAGPCKVTQIKTNDDDGYSAVQLGFEEKKEKNVTKPIVKHFEKAGLKPHRILREIKDFDDGDSLKLGDELTVGLFTEGDLVSVTGWSKGKGFQGVMKRHGFSGGPKSHGQSDRLRAPGSIGQSSTPSRVFKGVRMGGRMGNDRVTLNRRRIVRINAEKHIVMLEGSVPGAAGGLVIIKN